ncbi:putative reverse transcriptase domain-containing protein [Tanacetum coccineum]
MSYFVDLKNKKYEWGMEQEEAFQNLKNNLSDASILSLPDGVEDFVVYYDASNQGLGYVLMERGKSRVRGMILAAQSEAFKQENALAERLHGEGQESKAFGVIAATRDTRGTRLDISTAYHPQTDGKNKRTIQTLEDMLRAYVINFGGNWDVYLPLAEFSYNNSYHSSIQCTPFEALYGRKCRLPVLWAKIGESSLIRPELVQETTNKVVLIKEKLKAMRDHQKSYADNRRPFEILERIGPVAYRLRLPEELSSVHDTFHVSNLKKCLADANLHVPLDEIKIDKTLRFVEEPVEIMDREVRSLKRSKISLVKVCWNSKHGPEFTWEREDHMKSKYPQLFVDRAVEPAS